MQSHYLSAGLNAILFIFFLRHLVRAKIVGPANRHPVNRFYDPTLVDFKASGNPPTNKTKIAVPMHTRR